MGFGQGERAAPPLGRYKGLVGGTMARWDRQAQRKRVANRFGQLLAATLMLLSPSSPLTAQALTEQRPTSTLLKHPAAETKEQTRTPAHYDFLQALEPLFRERVLALAERSSTWRAALDTLETSDFRVVIGRPDQIRRRIPGMEYYHASHLGEVIPRRGPEGDYSSAVIMIDLARLRAMWRLTGLPRTALLRDIDRILIHELYGHVVPLARTRELAGGCPDPGPREPARSSCAIVRENRVRAELGIEPRTAYDLSGLVTGRWLELLRSTGEFGPDRD